MRQGRSILAFTIMTIAFVSDINCWTFVLDFCLERRQHVEAQMGPTRTILVRKGAITCSNLNEWHLSMMGLQDTGPVRLEQYCFLEFARAIAQSVVEHNNSSSHTFVKIPSQPAQ